MTTTPGVHPRKAPVGVYDDELFCEDCDVGVLGRLDQHAAEGLLQGSPVDLYFHEGRTLSRSYPTADPIKLHRFLLSVAWRASLTSHFFFSKVALGRYEEVIRAALLDQSASTDPLETALAEFDAPSVAALDPHRSRMDGVRFWVIYADRFVFYVKADKRPMPSFFEDLAIRPGRQVQSVVRDWVGSRQFQHARKIALANRNAFRPKR